MQPCVWCYSRILANGDVLKFAGLLVRSDQRTLSSLFVQSTCTYVYGVACLRPPQVLLYLSRAYYDSDDLQQAKKVLLKAIHRDPADYHMRFNVALTMQV
eukprot:1161515-Pelagomonas_calceolata.AAC.13